MIKSAGSETPGDWPTLLLHAYFYGELDTASALSVKQRIDAAEPSHLKLPSPHT
jgi:hypothetical protein